VDEKALRENQKFPEVLTKHKCGLQKKILVSNS
jgi:hypothetical protein